MTLQATDEMARAFFAALDDGELGADDIAEIKTGLNAALQLIDAPEQAASVPDVTRISDDRIKQIAADAGMEYICDGVWRASPCALRSLIHRTMMAAAPEAPAVHADLRDAERLNWALPFITGEDTQIANTRTILLAHQLLTGKTGKTAIDAAIAAEKGGA